MTGHFNELRDYFYYVFVIINPNVIACDIRVFSVIERCKRGDWNMDAEKTAEETETTDERIMQDESGETPEEAHREGEFSDLLHRIESMESSVARVLDTVDELNEQLKQRASMHRAMAVDDGAQVRDGARTEDIEEDIIEETIPDFKDFDLSL